MRLDLLLKALPAASVAGRTDIEISAVVAHHEQVAHQGLFVAIRGFTHDGHDFVHAATARGAAAVVVAHPVDVPSAVTQIRFSDTRLALALLSAAYYGNPSHELEVIGVTGTNGKGTTSSLIEALLTAGGIRCGVIGTMGAKIGTQSLGLERTTPEAPVFQQLLRQMVDAGLQTVVVEVASHALALHRVAGTRFRAAVFTNLTQDHLDFHQTLDDYREAKQRLFALLEPDGVAVINADDPSAEAMAQRSRAPVVTYGIERPAQIRARDLRLRLDGTGFTLETPGGVIPVSTRLRGRFNVSNTLAAAAVALTRGVPLQGIAQTLRTFPGVAGRFEAIDAGQEFGVVVDYAHTPDGLLNVLRTARDFVTGRLIVVFGAGGDRDRSKRPQMGATVAALADVAIVTSDNPRSEDPTAIITDILAGMREPGVRAHVEVEPDRQQAIFRAVALAGPGDFVIIAGKGHERYQEISGMRHPFDDREKAVEALRARAAHA